MHKKTKNKYLNKNLTIREETTEERSSVTFRATSEYRLANLKKEKERSETTTRETMSLFINIYI